jgi:hypothetical protein
MSETRDLWRDLVARWRSSGQTARDFADRHGVNASTLSGWAWRLKREDAGERGGNRGQALAHVPTMIEVRTRTVPEGCFELDVGGRVVRVPPSFDDDALRRLIDVLEERV